MLQDNLSVNAAGHLTVAGVDAVELAAEYGTPLFVMDEERLRTNMRRYAVTMRKYFPAGSMPLMASKALSMKEIYRIADSEGIGADVVSAGELYTALAAGFPADADEVMIKNVITLFCEENLAEMGEEEPAA